MDLLLVDSGDLHDGTGLSDGYPPGGIDAHDVRGLTFPNYKLLKASGLLSSFLPTVKSVHQEIALRRPIDWKVSANTWYMATLLFIKFYQP